MAGKILARNYLIKNREKRRWKKIKINYTGLKIRIENEKYLLYFRGGGMSHF